MSTLVWPLALAALGSVLIGWGFYIATIPRDRVPRTPILMFITQVTGVGLGVSSFLVGSLAGDLPGAAIFTAGFAIFMALFFLVLFTQRKTPLGKIQVEVGSPMLAFDSKASDGNIVSSNDWRGRRILLKFFRGFW